MRVNARLDQEAAAQLTELMRSTGMGVTEALKTSVLHYAEWLRGSGKPRLLHLRAAVGKQGSGRSDVSANAKALLADELRVKHSAPRNRARGPV